MKVDEKFAMQMARKDSLIFFRTVLPELISDWDTDASEGKCESGS